MDECELEHTISKTSNNLTLKLKFNSRRFFCHDLILFQAQFVDALVWNFCLEKSFDAGRPADDSVGVSSILLEMVVVSSYGAVPVSKAEAPAEAARSSTNALKIAGAVMAGLMAAVLLAAVATSSQVLWEATHSVLRLPLGFNS